MRITMIMLLAASVLLGGFADAKNRKWEAKDPAGDDNGPGSYVYPTDGAYKPGSFDLRQVTLREQKKNYQLSLIFNATLDNPWSMENGFSVQMAQVYLDFNPGEEGGVSDALPGMNAEFADGHGWERAVLVSPQSTSRLRNEIKQKVPAADQNKVIVPVSVSTVTNSVIVSIDKADLPELPSTIGLQVLVGSNEGFPDSDDILSRKVNEYEGAHRFGGGSDWEGDPHFMDILAGSAEGDKSEIEAQHAMLSGYVSGDDASKNELVKLEMVVLESNK